MGLIDVAGEMLRDHSGDSNPLQSIQVVVLVVALLEAEPYK